MSDGVCVAGTHVALIRANPHTLWTLTLLKSTVCRSTRTVNSFSPQDLPTRSVSQAYFESVHTVMRNMAKPRVCLIGKFMA